MSAIFAINKEELARQILLKKIPNVINNEGYITLNESCYYLFEYDLDYDEYEEIYEFMKLLSEAQYAFLRLDEGNSESEEQGNVYAFDLSVTSTITSPVGIIEV